MSSFKDLRVVELITAEHMDEINDKRAKEKKKA